MVRSPAESAIVIRPNDSGQGVNLKGPATLGRCSFTGLVARTCQGRPVLTRLPHPPEDIGALGVSEAPLPSPPPRRGEGVCLLNSFLNLEAGLLAPSMDRGQGRTCRSGSGPARRAASTGSGRSPNRADTPEPPRPRRRPA